MAGVTDATATTDQRKFSAEEEERAMQRMIAFLGQELTERGFLLVGVDENAPATAENARLAWENIEYFAEVRFRLGELLVDMRRLKQLVVTPSEWLVLLEKAQEAEDALVNWAYFYREQMQNPFGYVGDTNEGMVFTAKGQEVLAAVIHERLRASVATASSPTTLEA